MKQLLFIATIISVIACNQQKTESKETKTETTNLTLDSVRSAINAALDYHTAASNNYDPKACGEMFTDNASVIEYVETVKKLNGLAEIDSSLALELAGFKKANLKFDVKWTTNLLRLAGEKAYQDASVMYTINSPEAEPVKVNAEAMMVWKKTGENKWQAHTIVLYANQ